MGSSLTMRVALGLLLFVAGCDALGNTTQDDLLGAPASHGDTPTIATPAGASSQAPAPAAAPSGLAPRRYDDAQAVDWLQSRCGACHAPSASGRIDGSWPMPKAVSVEWLESTEFTTVAYELMRRKAYEPSAVGYPAPMPRGALDADATNALYAMLDWFQRRLPFSVADADVFYHRKANALPRPKSTFQCNLPASLSTFLGRLTNAALNRAPTPAELAVWSASDLGAPVTTAQRTQLVRRLWKAAQRSRFPPHRASSTGLRSRTTTTGCTRATSLRTSSSPTHPRRRSTAAR